MIIMIDKSEYDDDDVAAESKGQSVDDDIVDR